MKKAQNTRWVCVRCGATREEPPYVVEAGRCTCGGWYERVEHQITLKSGATITFRHPRHPDWLKFEPSSVSLIWDADDGLIVTNISG